MLETRHPQESSKRAPRLPESAPNAPPLWEGGAFWALAIRKCKLQNRAKAPPPYGVHATYSSKLFLILISRVVFSRVVLSRAVFSRVVISRVVFMYSVRTPLEC